MRILGVCPDCGAYDSIVAHEGPPADMEEWGKATCAACKKQWKHWLSLVSIQSGTENELIPVSIDECSRYVKVEWPMDVLMGPFGRLIVKVFNTALMVRFNLDVCMVVEGGVQGIIGDEQIELRNMFEEIGLFDEYDFEDSIACLKILPWYAELLRLILEEELVVGDHNIGRGAILRISRDDPDGEVKAVGLLEAVLCKQGGEELAKEVFERLAKEFMNPFSGSHIAGLTDEEVMQLFVPPSHLPIAQS